MSMAKNKKKVLKHNNGNTGPFFFRHDLRHLAISIIKQLMPKKPRDRRHFAYFNNS